MQANNALVLSNRNKRFYTDNRYSKIEKRIDDAIKDGKTEILFTVRDLPEQEVIDRFRAIGYNWFVMQGMFMPFPIYTLSWAKHEKPKNIFSRILSIFKVR